MFLAISMQLLQQYGLIDYAARRNFKHRKGSERKNGDDYRGGLTLADLGGPFCIMSIGNGLALIVFISELVTHRRDKIRRRLVENILARDSLMKKVPEIRPVDLELPKE